MHYIDRIKSAQTIEDLYVLRDEIRSEYLIFSATWRESGGGLSNEFLPKTQEANFYLSRVEAQILHLEKKGVFLNNIGKAWHFLKQRWKRNGK